MKSIGIQNLKSIVNSGDIELKNMTVVIGKNSSGKSTLLRTFPLLKQSITKSLSSPILWYGDYVDFGSFKKALTHGASSNNVVLSFVFDSIDYNRSLYGLGLSRSLTETRISLTIDDKNITEYLIEFKNGNCLQLILGKKNYSVLVNGETVDGVLFQPSFESGFFPRRVIETDSSFDAHASMIFDEYFFEFAFRRRRSELIDPIDFIFDKTKREKSIKSFFTFAKNGLLEDPSHPYSKENMASYLISEIIYGVLSSCEKAIRATFENVQYFEPLRTRGDRFYRVQGLNVKEVDSNGENAPMILYGMKGTEKNKFQKWCEDNLGFFYDAVDVGDGNESASVVVHCNSNDDNYNMTDVGFGYSQIFPIVLSIWMSFFSREKSISNKTVVIEQPELHLHPAFQKKIIGTFLKLTKLAKEKNKDLKFIIETHSETIVNYLGQLIADEKIDKNDINLLVCNKINNESVFKRMIFNKNGTIENWPSGFFSDD